MKVLKKILPYAISISCLILVYLVINGGLIGVQSVFKQGDKAKLEALEEILLEKQSKIKEKEDYIFGLRDEISSLENELYYHKDTIDYYETEYLNGIPDEYYNEYLDSFDAYNLLYGKYETLIEVEEREYEAYNSSIDEYNEQLKEAEKLAEKVGTTWVLLPLGGRH
jgi:predicted RNase H-like nuclease (RuvC/YqgF family)